MGQIKNSFMKNEDIEKFSWWRMEQTYPINKVWEEKY